MPKTKTTTKKKRNRRTPEQMIADLEAKIEAVKTRAAKREVRNAPDGKALLNAVRGIDKAAQVAQEHANDEMVKALEAARAPLSTQLVAMGLRMPSSNGRRGRRRKPTEEE